LSELAKRVLFAIPAAALFLTVAWLGGLYFEITIGIIALITVWEVDRIQTNAGSPGVLTLSILTGLFFWFSSRMPENVVVIIAALLFIITTWVVFGNNPAGSRKWLSTIFTGMYVPVGFIMLVHMRNLGEGIDGFWLILSFFLMIWGNDVFAYFGGKNFGKRPLAPVISPKKTWEGFWFGFIGAATGFSVSYIIAGTFPLPYWSVIAAVIIVSTAGPLGDITASSLKRKAGVKDSSALLPGHGGFFDRFDSMILSAPFIFFYYYFLIQYLA
jgi:phosphatidate cytidylyltransferase